jgi:hypothetical protein
MADKVRVSTRALIQRINRKLAAQDEALRVSRDRWQERLNLGEYYIVNTRINGVVHKDVDIDALGHELGALRRWEVHEEARRGDTLKMEDDR